MIELVFKNDVFWGMLPEHAIKKKIKNGPLVSAKNMTLQINFFFWTMGQIFHFPAKRNEKILMHQWTCDKF